MSQSVPLSSLHQRGILQTPGRKVGVELLSKMGSLYRDDKKETEPRVWEFRHCFSWSFGYLAEGSQHWQKRRPGYPPNKGRGRLLLICWGGLAGGHLAWSPSAVAAADRAQGWHRKYTSAFNTWPAKGPEVYLLSVFLWGSPNCLATLDVISGCLRGRAGHFAIQWIVFQLNLLVSVTHSWLHLCWMAQSSPGF
jgi:hypothetical protein